VAKALVTEALSHPLRPPTCCIAVGLLLRADISAATCIKSKLSPRVRRDRENMREIAVQLALRNPAYVDMCVKFVSHFLWIASSMLRTGDGSGMWDEGRVFLRRTAVAGWALRAAKGTPIVGQRETRGGALTSRGRTTGSSRLTPYFRWRDKAAVFVWGRSSRRTT